MWVAVCCSVLKPNEASYSIQGQTIEYACCSTLQCIARCCFVMYCSRLQQTATDCNKLQQTVTDYNRLMNTLQQTTTHWYTHPLLYHARATYFNTLQHTTTHCNTLQHTDTRTLYSIMHEPIISPIFCINTLQPAATRCNTLQHTATRCNACNKVQHTATNALYSLMHESYISASKIDAISRLLKNIHVFCRI